MALFAAHPAFADDKKAAGFDQRLLSDAQAWLVSADQAIAEKNWPRANVMLRWGVPSSSSFGPMVRR
jgi:hypothetical protein